MTDFLVGDIVCIHGTPDLNGDVFPWIGEVCAVRMDKYDLETRGLRVKQLGHQQITSFPVMCDDLRETVLTFEGPQCVICKVPY